MKTIEMKVDYGGQDVDINILPEENCAGTFYPVEANGKYVFTFLEDEDGEWSVMQENNANAPFVENDLYNIILKKLHYELMYVA
jgi:hypothetical protein